MSASATRRPRRAGGPDRAVDLAVAGAIALAVLGPLLLGRGSWLFGDMVIPPEQPWKDAWLGRDGALPRAVPMDALVSLATQVVPGELVQKVLLAGGFVLGGLGAGRLARRLGPPRAGGSDGVPWYARAAAIVALCWNPWVLERLLIGQWAILLGYLLLPWVALAGLRLRDDPRALGRAAVVLVAAAVCSPSSGVMAAGTLLVIALPVGAGRRAFACCAGSVAALALVANLTWIVPALGATSSGAAVSTDGVFAAFGARAESSAGLAASLLGTGGIWKTSVVPPERQQALVVLLAAGLAIACLAALAGRADRLRWYVLAGSALLVAALPALPGGTALLDAAGARVPGLALLRDSHRYLAPLGLVLAVGAAHLVQRLRAFVRPGTGALWSAIALVVLAPVLLLPSLAWGELGALTRTDYPPAWARVAAQIGPREVTVVLPWAGSYRAFDWNGRRAVLDPAPRVLPGTVIIDDTVVLDGLTVPAEDPRVRRVARALGVPDTGVRRPPAAPAAAPAASAAALRALGVRWVLVEQDAGPLGPEPAGRIRVDADGLRLIDLAADGPIADASAMRHAGGPRSGEDFWPIGQIPPILLLSLGVLEILRKRE